MARCRSRSLGRAAWALLLLRGSEPSWARAEILGEVADRAHHRGGREATQCAERAEFHCRAEVLDEREVRIDLLAAHDAVDHLGPACRPDPAGRAFAARFDGAELHREARLASHVDGVVEDDDATMTDEPVARGEGFVVERRVEESAREIGAERPADLDRAHGPAARRAAADLVDELAESEAERRLEKPAMPDVAGELDRHRAARAAHAEIAIGRRALGQDDRH